MPSTPSSIKSAVDIGLEETKLIHDDFSVGVVGPGSLEATSLMRLLSTELAKRYNFVDDGFGNFKAEDVLVPGSVFLIGQVKGVPVACGLGNF